MAASSWKPKQEILIGICCALDDKLGDNEMLERLKRYSHCTDLNNYLAFIFARAESIRDISMVVRERAGCLLGENLICDIEPMPGANQEYIKSELLHCLEVAFVGLEVFVGNAISAIVQLEGVSGWPELVQALVKCLQSNAANQLECAVAVLSQICHDIPHALNSETPGLSGRPINMFLPTLLELLQSPNASLREQSLRSVNQLIKLMPTALHLSMDQCVKGLVFLANAPNQEIWALVCEAFVQLIEVYPDLLKLHLRDIINCVLGMNKPPNKIVAFQACRFWSACCEAQLAHKYLKELLPRLIRDLLTDMAYLENDPYIVKAKDDHVFSHSTLRKCSADALHSISTVFEDKILPTLMPIFWVKLPTDVWKEREAAVFALYVIADDCIKGLSQDLPLIVASLIPLLKDDCPWIRRISCLTLSRFSKFIVKERDDGAGVVRFDNVLRGLVANIADENKRVQESACSAFETFVEVFLKDIRANNVSQPTGEMLVPNLRIILHGLVRPLEENKRLYLRIVYDAITTLAEEAGGLLNKPELLGILMPPLISKWEQLSDSHGDLYPLMQCLTFIAQAIGGGFSPYAQKVFKRCINVIQTQQLTKVDRYSAKGHYNEELVFWSLHLLSRLAEALGSGVDRLVVQVSPRNFRKLLLQCCMDDSPKIKEAAFALFGNLARACPVYLRPDLKRFLDVAVTQINVRNLQRPIVVAANACWGIGELAIKVRQEVSPMVNTALSCLVTILHIPEDFVNSIAGRETFLIRNSAVTLGRLAWVCPELVSPHMDNFMQQWCMVLSTLPNDAEKEDAFRGLCALVRTNPSKALKSLAVMCEAITSWHEEITSEDLRKEVAQVLLHYKHVWFETIFGPETFSI